MPLMHTLNLLGLNCPIPQIKTKQALNQLPFGDYLKVLVSTYPCFESIIQISNSLGYTIIISGQISNYYEIVIKK